jgi:carboxymethylenebutenolidase
LLRNFGAVPSDYASAEIDRPFRASDQPPERILSHRPLDLLGGLIVAANGRGILSDTHISRAGGLTRRLLIAGAVSLSLAVAAPAWAGAPKVDEKDVVIKTPDGSAEAAVFYPAAKGRKWPAVLFWPDRIGLRPQFRDMARKFAAKGYVVLVPNTFYRSMRPSDAELDVNDPAVRASIAKYRAQADAAGIARDTLAYLGFLDTLEQTDTHRKAGTFGYDLGGAYAVLAAAGAPDRIAAVGSVYGLGVAASRPDSPHLLVPKTKAAYYIAMSQDDDAREPGDKIDIMTVIEAGKLKGTVEVYPANHWWADPLSKTYDAAATERVFEALLKLCRDNLK